MVQQDILNVFIGRLGKRDIFFFCCVKWITAVSVLAVGNLSKWFSQRNQKYLHVSRLADSQQEKMKNDKGCSNVWLVLIIYPIHSSPLLDVIFHLLTLCCQDIRQPGPRKRENAPAENKLLGWIRVRKIVWKRLIVARAPTYKLLSRSWSRTNKHFSHSTLLPEPSFRLWSRFFALIVISAFFPRVKKFNLLSKQYCKVCNMHSSSLGND